MTLDKADALVIGGGFFGARLALELASQGTSVLLMEQADRLLTRASANNQARIHNGYHYPRSVLTALRSRVHFPRFVREYGDCIDESFAKIYAIGRVHSKLSAAQFRTFCQRIEADIAPAPPDIARLFNPSLIEAAFLTKEYALDVAKLQQRLTTELAAAGVRVMTGTEAQRVTPTAEGLQVEFIRDGQTAVTSALHVYHCTYARMNYLLRNSGLPIIPLKHELAELALVEMPTLLRDLGITVMDGPFFSAMPYPARGLQTLSHVRYTPHFTWRDDQGTAVDPYAELATAPRQSHFPAMIRDASRYLPLLGSCTYHDSLWEIKTVLPISEQDDSRPILYIRDHGLPGLTCILGGKLDNVFDLLSEIGLQRGAG